MNPRARRKTLLWVLAAAAAALLASRWTSAPAVGPLEVGGGRPAPPAARALLDRGYAAVSSLEEADFTRLDAADAGGWLAVHPEPVVPLEAYQLSSPVRPTVERQTLVLQPLGPFSKDELESLETLRDYAAAYFQLPARIAPPIELDLPGKPFRWKRNTGSSAARSGIQYDAGKILDEVLAPRVPPDAVAYLGVTRVDLWVESLNFVFGLGSYDRRVGVYSLVRYSSVPRDTPPADAKRLELVRACKVLSHETGHIFGISHCVFYHCTMNGTNSLPETDAAPLHECPVCHRKLLWNLGFDPLTRFSGLEAFYRRHGIAEEADWIHARAASWSRRSAEPVPGQRSSQRLGRLEASATREPLR